MEIKPANIVNPSGAKPTAAGPVSFASTVASSNGSATTSSASSTTSTSGKNEPRTIIFGAYNSPSQSGGVAKQQQSQSKQQKGQVKTPLVYIPRTQSAPPKENNEGIVSAANPSTAEAGKSGFHADAQPYNPNAQIFLPGGHYPSFYPPPAVSGYRPAFVPRQSSAVSITSSTSPSSSLENESQVTNPVTQPPASTLPLKTPSKAIKIVDPNTKQELKLDTIPKISKPSPSSITNIVDMTVNEKAVSEPSTKKAIQIVDPSSHKPVMLSTIDREPEVANGEKSGDAIKESSLAAKKEQVTHKDEITNVEDALKALKFDDDDINSAVLDMEDSESDLDEEEYDTSGLLRHGQKITYPERYLPYEESGPVWKYSRRFLIQFMPVCTQKPDKSSFFSRVALKEQYGGGRGRKSKKVLTEAEREALLLSLNRSDNAWTPVFDEKTLAEEERVLREAKGILNKLTLDKFDVLSDKIISLGITSENVQGGMISLLFDKSTDEPKFASMYAMLALKISRKDLEESRDGTKVESKPESSKAESKFRRLLLNKCQYEFNNKRDWSRHKHECAAKTSSGGELTEEDYAQIKLKRRILGNMRFIGELFMQGLLGERIMHMIVNELSQDVETPEEDEVECLCKLMTTVGRRLDHGESMQVVNVYMERMKIFYKHPKLSPRIRFACLDLIELRSRGWISKDEPLKTMAQIQASSSASPQQSFASASTNSSFNSEMQPKRMIRDSKEYRDNKEHRGDRDRRTRVAQRSSNQPNEEEGWKVSGTSESIYSSRSTTPTVRAAKSFNIKDLKEKSSAVSISPTAPCATSTSNKPLQSGQSSTDSLNRFQALGLEDENSPTNAASSIEEFTAESSTLCELDTHSEPDVQSQTAPKVPAEVHPDVPSEPQGNSTGEASKLISKALGVYDEYVDMQNLKDLLNSVKEIPTDNISSFCHQMILMLLEAPKGHLEHFSLFAAASRNVIGETGPWYEAVKLVISAIDDLSIDIPNAFSSLGCILRTLSDQSLLSGKDVLECFETDTCSFVSKFKIIGHMNVRKLDSLDYTQLTSVDRKLIATFAMKHNWHNYSASVAEIAFRHRIEAIPSTTPNFYIPAAKAVIHADFAQSALPPLSGLHIFLTIILKELSGKSLPTPNETLMVVVSPFLTNSTSKSQIKQVIANAGKACDADALVGSFITYLEELRLV